MPKSRSSDQFTKFLEGLKRLVSMLPTHEDKRTAQANLDTLIEFLGEVRSRLEALPSQQDRKDVSRAIEELQALSMRARRDPFLAPVLGSRPPQRTQRGKRVVSVDPARIKSVVASLQALPGDDIRSTLQSDVYSAAELRAIAAEVGIPGVKGLSRDALAHQITMKIVNYRGYQLLRGECEPTREAQQQAAKDQGSKEGGVS